MGATSIAAALMHDVEDTDINGSQDMKNVQSEDCLQLVEGLTKIAKVKNRSRKYQYKENFRKNAIDIE